MGLTAKDTGEGQTFDPIPQKVHHGICVAVIDLGTHLNPTFGKKVHKVLITWELPNERIIIEKESGPENLPRWISAKYTLSLHEKANLRKLLESWRGKGFTMKELEGFDLKNILTVNCMVQVIHNTKDDKTYANVSTVIPLMEGMEKKEAENPYLYFSFEEDFDIPEGVPDWVVDIIKDSDEWKKQFSPKGSGSSQEEQSPFDGPEPDEDQIPF